MPRTLRTGARLTVSNSGLLPWIFNWSHISPHSAAGWSAQHGGLFAFSLCGIFCIVGVVVALAGVDYDFVLQFVFGPFHGPEVAFAGTVAAAARAKRTGKLDEGRTFYRRWSAWVAAASCSSAARLESSESRSKKLSNPPRASAPPRHLLDLARTPIPPRNERRKKLSHDSVHP
ncbi:hypothetical protein HQO90_25155 [Rhodococcus fascians]|nr:hypothetical protein [Rhodococcus fascians]MBY4061074.1 hypothetical protein [Rhodococcus fascians]MBY4071252.1 hypothetical protein [Rhodococcus fascians]